MNPSDYDNQLLFGIAHLTAAITNIRLYSKEHPQVQRYIDKAFTTLANVLNNLPDLTFMLIGDDIVLNKKAIKRHTPHLSQFRRLLQNNGIEHLTLKAGLTKSELEKFILSLASSEMRFIQSQPSIRLGKVNLDSRRCEDRCLPLDSTPGQIYDPSQLEALDLFQQIPWDNFRELYLDIKKQKTANVTGIEGVVKSFIKGFSYGLKPLQMLANLKGADQYTFTHVVNVCLLTMAQAEVLGISGRQLFDVGIAAVLHDVGKLFVPDDILNKPGMLTEEERTIIETHSISGARYILKLSNVPELAILGALEHHIRYDGSGYPYINSHWRPHLISQMIAIADIYDAMRSRRPYQNPKPEKLILNILRKEKGTAFNPHLVDNFLSLLHQPAHTIPNQGLNPKSQSHLDQTYIPQISNS